MADLVFRNDDEVAFEVVSFMDLIDKCRKFPQMTYVFEEHAAIHV